MYVPLFLPLFWDVTCYEYSDVVTVMIYESVSLSDLTTWFILWYNCFFSTIVYRISSCPERWVLGGGTGAWGFAFHFGQSPSNNGLQALCTLITRCCQETGFSWILWRFRKSSPHIRWASLICGLTEKALGSILHYAGIVFGNFCVHKYADPDSLPATLFTFSITFLHELFNITKLRLRGMLRCRIESCRCNFWKLHCT